MSESLESAGLSETVEAVGLFAGGNVNVYALPRLSGGDKEKWRGAPDLTWLCPLE